MMKRSLSCTIIAKDEADRIGRCIESVRGLADEVVVVDSGSTDGTQDICRALGARCHFNAWIGYGQQKRCAEDLASHDWVLNLDADEWLTEEARRDVAAILEDPSTPRYAYRFKIKHVYPGRAGPRFLADYHHYIRLYDKTRCRFPDSAVFDEIKVAAADRGDIAGAIFHQSIRSLPHLIRKNVAYYRLQRGEVRKNRLLAAPRIVVEPFGAFIKYYVFKRHVTGGFYGLAVAATIAMLRTYRLVILFTGRRPSTASDRPAPSAD